MMHAYLIRRANINKALDATDAAIFFLDQVHNEQVRHCERPNTKLQEGRNSMNKVFTACMS